MVALICPMCLAELKFNTNDDTACKCGNIFSIKYLNWKHSSVLSVHKNPNKISEVNPYGTGNHEPARSCP